MSDVIRLIRKAQNYEARWLMNESVAHEILEWISIHGGTAIYVPEKSTRDGDVVEGFLELMDQDSPVAEYGDWIVWNGKDKFGVYTSLELEAKFKQIVPQSKPHPIHEAVQNADSIDEAVGLVVGMASTCWIGFFDTPPDLVFDDVQAKEAVDALVSYVRDNFAEIQPEETQTENYAETNTHKPFGDGEGLFQ